MKTTIAIVFLLSACSAPTICATREAQELDPEMNGRIVDAVNYWDKLGYSGIVAVDDVSCDIPVRPARLGGMYARAEVTVYAVSDDCTPEYIEINISEWDNVLAEDLSLRVLAHEVGHLYCLPDESSGDGIMSQKTHARIE